MNEAARFKKELLIQEYGSNVLKIVEHINTVPDKAKRTDQCKLLIKLIEKMNPSISTTLQYFSLLLESRSLPEGSRMRKKEDLEKDKMQFAEKRTHFHFLESLGVSGCVFLETRCLSGCHF